MISPRTHPRPRLPPWFAPSGISPASEASPKAVPPSSPTRGPPPIRKCHIFTCTSLAAATSAQCCREGDQRRDAFRIASPMRLKVVVVYVYSSAGSQTSGEEPWPHTHKPPGG